MMSGSEAKSTSLRSAGTWVRSMLPLTEKGFWSVRGFGRFS